jgi:putative phage-type endonuclease
MLFGYQLPTLKNIINLFNWNSILTVQEKDEVELSIATLIDNFIEGDPLGFSSPYFELKLKDYVFKNMLISLKEIFVCNSNSNSNNKINQTANFFENKSEKEKKLEKEQKLEKELEDELEIMYEKIHKIYFTKYYPLRSYTDTFIRIEPNMDTLSKKIADIETKPQPDQRTNEWYLFRHNLITASSAWKVFKSQSSINQLIVEKCKEIDVTKYDSVNTNTPMHHGNKYEEVSIMLYEYMYDTKVKDYGCIQHDVYKFLGASPDGISVDPKSKRYGRMLEIKNPTSREITGIPKEDYWIQMQLQMETCNLNECDFLETVFKEYEIEEDFMADGTFTHTEEDQLKGIIVYFMKEGKPFYEYMPLYTSKEEYEIWYEAVMIRNSHLTWIKDIFWRLEDYSCILVLRNKLWFEHAIPKIQAVWTIIEHERHTGHTHRLPKSQNRKPRSNSLLENVDTNTNTDINTNNGCLIDTECLQNQIIYIDTKYELVEDISGQDISGN